MVLIDALTHGAPPCMLLYILAGWEGTSRWNTSSYGNKNIILTLFQFLKLNSVIVSWVALTYQACWRLYQKLDLYSVIFKNKKY